MIYSNIYISVSSCSEVCHQGQMVPIRFLCPFLKNLFESFVFIFFILTRLLNPQDVSGKWGLTTEYEDHPEEE